MGAPLISVGLPLLQAVVPEGGAVAIPQEITVSTPEILAKFSLMFLSVLAAGGLPWLLLNSSAPLLRRFRMGAVYALLPAVIVGTGLASVLTGISLTRIKFGTLSEFWPLPLTIFALILALESAGGVLGVVARAGEGEPAP